MADFNRKKLQVFVSSTFTDLKNERQAAVEAILTAGHIPAGMELFTAGDESQMDVIKQWIDESDVYLLILGGRYGSIEPKSGKSYIHLEYEYALSRDKPLFACVLKEEAIDPRVKKEGRSAIEMDNQQKLKEFRTVVLSKMIKFWEDSKDIKLIIIETLSLMAKRENLVGWIRPSAESNLPAITDEIARLSKENAQLRNQLNSGNQEDKINGLTYQEIKRVLEANGVADFLSIHRDEFNTEFGLMTRGDDKQEEMALELCLRGLLTPRGRIGNGRYFMTESGRAYLNKYDAEQVSLKDQNNPVIDSFPKNK